MGRQGKRMRDCTGTTRWKGDWERKKEVNYGVRSTVRCKQRASERREVTRSDESRRPKKDRFPLPERPPFRSTRETSNARICPPYEVNCNIRSTEDRCNAVQRCVFPLIGCFVCFVCFVCFLQVVPSGVEGNSCRVITTKQWVGIRCTCSVTGALFTFFTPSPTQR